MNVQRMFQEVEDQRNIAFSRCAQMAGTIGDLEARIKELETPSNEKGKNNSDGVQNVKPLRPEKV